MTLYRHYRYYRYYRRSQEQIRTPGRPAIALRGVRVRPPKKVSYRALDVFVEANAPFGDASDVADVEWLRLPAIYAWDAAYDRLEGISRIEPEADAPLLSS
jgi:hypothetical protein